MKAIRVHAAGGADVLRYEDVPSPEPGAGEVRVKVEAIGINFIDVYKREGLYPIPLPATLGEEAAGTVDALGPGVSGLRSGDRVAWAIVPGAYAEQVVVPANHALRLPDGLDAKRGAAAMLQGMTAHYLAYSTFELNARHTCLVHAAAGGVGLLLCQMAKRLGARVLGTVSTDAKAKLAREAGADEVILYTQEDFAEAVRRLTGGAGAHVVYDSVGATTFEKSLGCLAPRGMLVLFGQSSGPVPPVDLQVLNRGGSLYVTRPSLGFYIATREELESRAGDVLGWVRDGSLKVRIGAEFPLEKAADAHRALEGRQTTGKVLLIP